MIRIFVSYRRDDAQGTAGRLADRLEQAVGRDAVFFDVHRIGPGVDFMAAIRGAVAECTHFVAVIGPDWVEAANRQRADDDVLALEVDLVLRRDPATVAIVPVLVGGAELPGVGALPERLRPLLRRNAARLNHATFGADVNRLLDTIAPARRPGNSSDLLPPRGSAPGWVGNHINYPVVTKPEDSPRLEQLRRSAEEPRRGRRPGPPPPPE